MYPSPGFPPVVTPGTSVVQCQNQEIDISTIHRPHLDFTSFICTHLCAHIRWVCRQWRL